MSLHKPGTRVLLALINFIEAEAYGNRADHSLVRENLMR